MSLGPRDAVNTIGDLLKPCRVIIKVLHYYRNSRFSELMKYVLGGIVLRMFREARRTLRSLTKVAQSARVLIYETLYLEISNK